MTEDRGWEVGTLGRWEAEKLESREVEMVPPTPAIITVLRKLYSGALCLWPRALRSFLPSSFPASKPSGLFILLPFTLHLIPQASRRSPCAVRRKPVRCASQPVTHPPFICHLSSLPASKPAGFPSFNPPTEPAGTRLRPMAELKISRAPIIRRQPAGSPRHSTPKDATSGTSIDIIMLTAAAGIRTRA